MKAIDYFVIMNIKQSLLCWAKRIRCYGNIGWFRGNLKLIDAEKTNFAISNAIRRGVPFFAGRLGSVEIKPIVYYWIANHLNKLSQINLFTKGDIDYIFDKEKYLNYVGGIMQSNAGFFPVDSRSLEAFADLYLNDIKDVDLCGCWLNEYLLHDCFSPSAQYCKLEHLEPYDLEDPWTQELEGKKVLVISPFSESIKKQYQRRQLIWGTKKVLPEFYLHTIKSVQSIAGTPTEFSSWFDALQSMKDAMDNIDYEIAIIGCGAYGFPLAAHAKRTGHQAIHLGGPVQILFGIKGKRWDNIPSVSKYYNEFWIRPSEAETPKGSTIVEGGCYW